MKEIYDKFNLNENCYNILCSLHNKNGIFIFELIEKEETTDDNEIEIIHYLEPKGMILDNEWLNYSEDMDYHLKIHSIDENLILKNINNEIFEIKKEQLVNFSFKLKKL